MDLLRRSLTCDGGHRKPTPPSAPFFTKENGIGDEFLRESFTYIQVLLSF